MSGGPDDASLAWAYYVSYRDALWQKLLLSRVLAGIVLFGPIVIYVSSYFPMDWNPDPSTWRWPFFLLGALGVPGYAVQTWADLTAWHAAATAKPKIVARSRARQASISILGSFAFIFLTLTALLYHGKLADAFPKWVQGLIAVNALGLSALGLVKDQVEDSIESFAAWRELPESEREDAKRRGKILLGERVKQVTSSPGPQIRPAAPRRIERLAFGLVALTFAVFKRTTPQKGVDAS